MFRRLVMRKSKREKRATLEKTKKTNDCNHLTFSESFDCNQTRDNHVAALIHHHTHLK